MQQQDFTNAAGNQVDRLSAAKEVLGEFLQRRKGDRVGLVVFGDAPYLQAPFTYIWWNPKTRQIDSKSLPSVTFEISAPPAAASKISPEENTDLIWWLSGAALICGIIAWRREPVANVLGACWHVLNPPEKVAARRLHRACRRNDATAASHAWTAWLDRQGPTFTPAQTLQVAAIDLQRHLYGPRSTDAWQGRGFAQAFREQLASREARRRSRAGTDLPLLNPSS